MLSAEGDGALAGSGPEIARRAIVGGQHGGGPLEARRRRQLAEVVGVMYPGPYRQGDAGLTHCRQEECLGRLIPEHGLPEVHQGRMERLQRPQHISEAGGLGR